MSTHPAFHFDDLGNGAQDRVGLKSVLDVQSHRNGGYDIEDMLPEYL